MIERPRKAVCSTLESSHESKETHQVERQESKGVASLKGGRKGYRGGNEEKNDPSIGTGSR